MTTLAFRLLPLALLGLFASQSFAADVWFYELRDPTALARSHARPAADSDHHWVLSEFDGMPYPGQLAALKSVKGFERVSLLFKLPPATALKDDYTELASGLAGRGVLLQFKFVGSLPTADDAVTLRGACEAGAAIRFISNSLPTPYEAANLQALGKCVSLDLVMGRYPRYDEISELKRLNGVGLTLVNDYFPQYAHMDILNIWGEPVALHVSDGTPSANDLVYLNGVKHLTTFSWEIKVIPDQTQYGALEKFKRTEGRRLALRWAFSQPGEADVAAWLRLQPDRLQVDAASFERFGERLRALHGEIIVETFPVEVDGRSRMEFSPRL